MKATRIISLWVGCFLVFASSVKGQPIGVIEGRMQCSAMGAPLTGANVMMW